MLRPPTARLSTRRTTPNSRGSHTTIVAVVDEELCNIPGSRCGTGSNRRAWLSPWLYGSGHTHGMYGDVESPDGGKEMNCSPLPLVYKQEGAEFHTPNESTQVPSMISNLWGLCLVHSLSLRAYVCSRLGRGEFRSECPASGKQKMCTGSTKMCPAETRTQSEGQQATT